jgi:hypothetical protein
MTKKAAIKLVNEALNLKLNSKSTIFILINADNRWRSKFPQEKRHQKLFILLNNSHSKKLHIFEIPANHFVYNLLYNKPFNENIFWILFNVEDDEFIEYFTSLNFKKFLSWSINYDKIA